MSLITKGVVALILASAAVSACAASFSSSSAGSTPVEILRGGDDGLTVRFADALEAAFRSAPEFSFNTDTVPDTLVVTIPSNVTWIQVGDRTKVNYSIQFTTTAARLLGSSNGTCWEDQLQKCAARALEDAKAVRRRSNWQQDFQGRNT